ncbi:hypothetical protein FRC16_001699 [Serendipita sp. 398]|nr:hypothetical protein FRC16_001699 [Serendipita sp. 398]
MSVTPLASRQTTLTFCIVCKSHAQIPQELPTEHCDHRPEVCLECLQQTVEAALSEGRDVLCPTLQCRKQLSHSNLKHWATPDVFDQLRKWKGVIE